ncbi:sulfite exporter TauE/SafE family protein [Flagellimonas allohymeniacidonis]|uniref:Probable membrane transporter protein n=1 Tax=Flagellimonas allohymeniacidonis TaxID=2517819 RepID=A0A4Q8QEQ5_9FLAO|nr:sulfite exporter TauE/SafE family protein [Allomuricauda hymeniacidonis]TAI48982.1 sulfite exporter TauE/SafE family protein [Allomuricauda hymeniacidonis]
MDEWYHYIFLIVVGFAVGFINTIAGGGSLLSLPILIFLGLPPNVANGTNRVAIVIQTAIATAGFKSKGVSTYPFNVYLGISAFFGSLIGARIAVDVTGTTFNRILAIVMLCVVLIIIFKPKMRLEEMEERLTGKYLWLSVVVFFFFGIYGGFINAGLGFLMILFMHFTNRMNLVRVNATKVVVIFVYMLAALAVFAYNDKVVWKVGLILAIGNGSGAWIASRFSVKKGDGFVKTFLVVMVVIMAIKLWFGDLLADFLCQSVFKQWC